MFLRLLKNKGRSHIISKSDKRAKKNGKNKKKKSLLRFISIKTSIVDRVICTFSSKTSTFKQVVFFLLCLVEFFFFCFFCDNVRKIAKKKTKNILKYAEGEPPITHTHTHTHTQNPKQKNKTKQKTNKHKLRNTWRICCCGLMNHPCQQFWFYYCLIVFHWISDF